MTMVFNSRAFGLAALLAAAVAGTAIAEEVKIPDGQLPPPEQAEPQKPKYCVDNQPGFFTEKGVHIFRVTLTNSCERRHRCTVHVYLTTSRGPLQGRTTLTLAKASRGKAAQKHFVIRTPENGGAAQVTPTCVAI